jgi:hypothetical protein
MAFNITYNNPLSKTLIVCCKVRLDAYETHTKIKLNHIYVSEALPHMFLFKGIKSRRVAKTLTQLADRIKLEIAKQKFTDVYVIGMSYSGFGAIYLSHLIKCTCYSFSPPTNITEPFLQEEYYAGGELRQNIWKNRQAIYDCAAEHKYHLDLSNIQFTKLNRVYIIYGNANQNDAKNAKLMTNKEYVELVPSESSDHICVFYNLMREKTLHLLFKPDGFELLTRGANANIQSELQNASERFELNV